MKVVVEVEVRKKVVVVVVVWLRGGVVVGRRGVRVRIMVRGGVMVNVD